MSARDSDGDGNGDVDVDVDKDDYDYNEESTDTLLAHFCAHAPALDGRSHKGQHGRLLVVGGSALYCGAPYFAAIGALRGGAELVSVVCAAAAAPAIKSYSPDLMVYPGLHYLADEQLDPLGRADAVVVGPGLGRGDDAVTAFERVLRRALADDMPLVVDADALWMLAQRAELRRLLAHARPQRAGALLLTPNAPELRRLLRATHARSAAALAAALGAESAAALGAESAAAPVVVVAKARVDAVTARTLRASVADAGALKRVGGQGDVLAGLLGVFALWMTRGVRHDADASARQRAAVAAAVAACTVTRRAARMAFLRHGRAMVASDALPLLRDALRSVLRDG